MESGAISTSRCTTGTCDTRPEQNNGPAPTQWSEINLRQVISSDVLDEEVLRQIAASGPIRTFPANAIIINEGDRTNSLYIILTGRVKVYADSSSGRSVVFGTYGKGEY